MNPGELKGALEAIIYAADEPATLEQLVNATGAGKDEVRAALEEMIAGCGADERGIEIRRVARGYRYSTKPQHHEAVRKFIKSLRPPVRLSMPALETLAVIAYKQPITLPEIRDIRGVDCAGVIGTLLEKKLVTTAGRKAVMGRPILYRTTKDFLLRFGLDGVDELPSLKEFEQLAREALGSDAEFEPGSEAASGAGGETAAAEGTAAESAAGGENVESSRGLAPAEGRVAVSVEMPGESQAEAGKQAGETDTELPEGQSSPE